MKYVSQFLISALVSGAAWAGPQQSATATDHSTHAAHAQPAAPAKQDTFAAYDKDKNGFVSKAEVAKHPKVAMFGMSDSNRDGRLDRAEFAMMESM